MRSMCRMSHNYYSCSHKSQQAGQQKQCATNINSITTSTQLITPGRLCMITKQADFVMYSSPICLYTVDPKCCGVQASCGLLHEVWLHADYACIAIWLVWIDSIVMHLRSIAFHSPLHQKTCASALGVTQAAMDTD